MHTHRRIGISPMLSVRMHVILSGIQIPEAEAGSKLNLSSTSSNEAKRSSPMYMRGERVSEPVILVRSNHVDNPTDFLNLSARLTRTPLYSAF